MPVIRFSFQINALFISQHKFRCIVAVKLNVLHNYIAFEAAHASWNSGIVSFRKSSNI